MKRIASTWFAGLLVLLPLALTVAVLAWLLGFLNRLIGPETLVGRGFAKLGYPVAGDEPAAYVIGSLILVAAIYLLGLAVEAGFQGPLRRFFLGWLARIPLFGKLYGFAEKMVGMLDRKPSAEIASMGAVWCFFGGDGAAVLALLPSSDPVDIEGRPYLGVMIPTAPVPIGGALLYVPIDWVRPANIGMDKLTAVYVSMGLTPPTANAPSVPPAPPATPLPGR